MEDLIFFIKNIFNPYRFEFSLAFANSFYPEFSKKELDSIMYAKTESASNIFNKEENNQLIDSNTQKKYSIMDRIRGIFSGRKGLPDPNQEYTMDDWINAQKNPVSRFFNNIARSTASMVKKVLSKSEQTKNENINIPSTPSQNFEMAENAFNSSDRNIIVPVSKKIDNVEKSQNTGIAVETINFNSEELEEAKAELASEKNLENSTSTKKTPLVSDINFDSKGLEEAKSSIPKENNNKTISETPSKSSNEEIEI